MEAAFVMAGLWVASNAIPVGSTAGASIGAGIVKILFSRKMKKRYAKKLCKYLSVDDLETVMVFIENHIEDISYSKLDNMRKRIKKNLKRFKKLEMDDLFEILISKLITSLGNDDDFEIYLEKVELMEEIVEVIMVLRKYSDKKTKKEITKKVFSLLVNSDLNDVKHMLSKVKMYRKLFKEALSYEDVVAYLETKDIDARTLEILRVVDFDVNKTYQLLSERIPSNDSIEVSTGVVVVPEKKKVVKKQKQIRMF